MRKDRTSGDRVYEPTAKDIRRACEEIQATWSPRKRAKRDRGVREPSWTPPMIRQSDLPDTVSGERADGLPYADGEQGRRRIS